MFLLIDISKIQASDCKYKHLIVFIWLNKVNVLYNAIIQVDMGEGDVVFYSEMLTILGILVAVLGVLVTALIGWQIYGGLKFDKYIKVMDRKVSTAISDYDHTVTALLMQVFTINNYHDRNLFTEAIDGYIISIEEALKGSRQDIIEGILHSILEIKPVYEDPKSKFNVLLYKGKREHYISILNKVRSNNAPVVKEFIASLKEQGE